MMMKTGKFLIRRVSPSGMPAMQTAEMASRLNEADLPCERLKFCLKKIKFCLKKIAICLNVISRSLYTDPTMVDGPNFSDWNPLPMMPITASRISGADDPLKSGMSKDYHLIRKLSNEDPLES